MINIGSFHPPVSTNKPLKHTNASERAAVAGSEIGNNSLKVDAGQDRRHKQDRRQRNIKPLIDMRCGRDRRNKPGKPSISIKV